MDEEENKRGGALEDSAVPRQSLWNEIEEECDANGELLIMSKNPIWIGLGLLGCC